MDYLRPKEVREQYKLSTTTLWQLTKQGKLNPARTPGGHKRYLRSELDSLLSLSAISEPYFHPRLTLITRITKQLQDSPALVEAIKQDVERNCQLHEKEIKELNGSICFVFDLTEEIK